MTSLDKYDQIYAKYSAAIDPPSYIDPPDFMSYPQKDAVLIKRVGLEPLSCEEAASSECDATTPSLSLEIKLPSTTTTHDDHGITEQYQMDPPEPKLAVASRDDDNDDGVRSVKQSDEERSRDDIITTKSTQMQSSLDKFNAKRISMRSIYGCSPMSSASILSTSSKVSALSSDPPSNDIESTLKYLTEQSLDRRATIFPISKSSKSESKSDRSAKAKKAQKAWIEAITNSVTQSKQPSSSSLSMKKALPPSAMTVSLPPSSSSTSLPMKKALPPSSSLPIKTLPPSSSSSSLSTKALPPPSSSLPMKALAMSLISEQVPDGFRITHDKCSDCANYMVEEAASNDTGGRKCVFCPINDFRAIIQGAVSNRVMAAKRIQGDALVVSDGKCEHCYSPTQKGISCDVCPLLDDICIEVAKAIGRGGELSYSSCNDCGSQHVRSSDGVQHCIVCNVLNEKFGGQQLYKPRKAIAEDAPPLEKYEATLHKTTQQLEKLQQPENDALQIQLDEELAKAKNAQSLLGTTLANIAHESKTRGVRTELKEELLKAKEAQLAFQKVLERSPPPPLREPDTPVVEQDETTAADIDFSGLSYEISQREIDEGNVKEYIPPPEHFFARGIPKTVSVKDRSYYTNNLKQSALDQERQKYTDCCGMRIQKQLSNDDRVDDVDDDSIDTDDQCTVDISLNSYEPKLSAGRHGGRKLPVKQTYREKKASKSRSQRRRWSFLNLCGCSPSFDSSEEPDAPLDDSNHTHDSDYNTNYRTQRLSFDNYEAFDIEEEYDRVLLRTNNRRDDDSSYDASMYSNITPHGILKPPRYMGKWSNASVVSDDQSRFSHHGQQKRRSDNSVSSSSDSRRVSFYNLHQHHRDLDIDKLKTLTEEGDDSFESQHPNPAIAEVRRTIAEYKSRSH